MTNPINLKRYVKCIKDSDENCMTENTYYQLLSVNDRYIRIYNHITDSKMNVPIKLFENYE